MQLTATSPRTARYAPSGQRVGFTRFRNRLAVGSSHTCQVNNDGTPRGWGLNNAGQLGNGDIADQSTPVLVIGLTNAVAMAAGRAHTYALLADGTALLAGP